MLSVEQIMELYDKGYRDIDYREIQRKYHLSEEEAVLVGMTLEQIEMYYISRMTRLRK